MAAMFVAVERESRRRAALYGLRVIPRQLPHAKDDGTFDLALTCQITIHDAYDVFHMSS